MRSQSCQSWPSGLSPFVFSLRPFPVPKTTHSFFSLPLVLLGLIVFLLCRKLSVTLIVFLSWWMLPCLLGLSTNTEMPLVCESSLQPGALKPPHTHTYTHTHTHTHKCTEQDHNTKDTKKQMYTLLHINSDKHTHKHTNVQKKTTTQNQRYKKQMYTLPDTNLHTHRQMCIRTQNQQTHTHTDANTHRNRWTHTHTHKQTDGHITQMYNGNCSVFNPYDLWVFYGFLMPHMGHTTPTMSLSWLQ